MATDRKITQMPTPINKSLRISQLIINAAMKAGSESKLASMLDETRQHVNAWKAGRRMCPLEAQILMGSICGQDSTLVLKQAVIERNEGNAKQRELIEALA